MFSYICFELLEALNKAPFELSIISPVPAKEDSPVPVKEDSPAPEKEDSPASVEEKKQSANSTDSLLTKNFRQGIGVFPDRIIFTITGEPDIIKRQLDKILLETKAKFAKKIYDNLQKTDCRDEFSPENVHCYFNYYLQFHYYFEPCNNDITGKKILAIQSKLSFIENSKTFNTQIRKGEDYLIRLYHGPDKNENKRLKQSSEVKEYKEENTNMSKENPDNLEKIDNYAAIASKAEENLKIGNYFAMVTADGDNFGAAIGEMSAAKLSDFSVKLSAYCGAAAEVIKAYGCPVYYVGGDDLMFLAPLKNNDKTLFQLCEDLNKLFKKSFKAHEVSGKPVSLSFGISIQYKKFPLYEALEIANAMLAQAKSSDIIAGKAKTALHLFKHSGKGMGIVFKNEMLEKIDKLVKVALDQREYLVRAIIYKLPQFSPLFESAYNNNKCANVLFDNLFDDFGVELSAGFDEAIKEFYSYIDREMISARCSKADDSAFFYSHDNLLFDKLLSLIVVLKIAKFYIESGDKNEQ